MAEFARGTAVLIAVALLAWIGFLQLARGGAVRRVRGVGVDGVPVAVSEPQFPLSVSMLTGAALATGNRVEVALNGDGTYPRLREDLRSARHGIARCSCTTGLLSAWAIRCARSCSSGRARGYACSCSTMRLGRTVFRVATSRRYAREGCSSNRLSSPSPVDVAPVPEPIARPRHRDRRARGVDRRVRNR